MRRRSLLSACGTALLVGGAGCLGSGGSGTPTGTPTPVAREFPYTAASPDANVDPRNLEISNRTQRDYDATVTITDTEAETTVLERTVSIAGESDHTFEDIIGKKGKYVISLQLAVGLSKDYRWPIDEQHGDADLSIAEGEQPNQPVVWFSVQQL